MSWPSSFNNSHTDGKATPTAIRKLYDITVRCNAGKSLHLYRGMFLFFLVWTNHINCKIHILLHPTPKLWLCIQQYHSKVKTDAIVIHRDLTHHKYFRTTEKQHLSNTFWSTN